MSTSLQLLIPDLQGPASALLDVAERAGVNPRVTSTFRTRAEQERLYRRFLAGTSVYPVAPPGTSAHEYGYAFDVLVNGEENQKDLGAVWQQWGGVWGGQADPVHFEYPGFHAPSTDETGGAASTPAAATVFDMLAALLPVVGEAETIGWLASLLPGLSENEIVQIAASPHTGKIGKWVGATLGLW